jgi:type II secretory pathway component GspD/PulD (secretin)
MNTRPQSKLILMLSLFVVGLAANSHSSQDPTGAATKQISISSKGEDVRGVLHDLFKQVNRNFVLQPGIHHALFLNLSEVPFDEALGIVCQLTKLEFEIQNDIYYISRSKPSTASFHSPDSQGDLRTVAAKGIEGIPVVPKVPNSGKLSDAVLKKAVSTKLAKTDIRVVLAHLSAQTSVAIEIDPSIPAYKIDAFLANTSLKFSLDQITKAAGLKYRFTNNLSIQVYREMPAARAPVQNRVTLITGQR